MSIPDRRRRYTVADYWDWPGRNCCELIRGRIHTVPLAVTPEQSEVLIVLASLFLAYLRNFGDGHQRIRRTRVCVAPVEIVLGPDSIVKPDLVLVSDPGKLRNDHYVEGVPDLVVEVKGSQTTEETRSVRRTLYETCGVIEYLLVAAEEQFLEISRLRSNRFYGPAIRLGPADYLRLDALPGFEARLAEVFDWPLPSSAG